MRWFLLLVLLTTKIYALKPGFFLRERITNVFPMCVRVSYLAETLPERVIAISRYENLLTSKFILIQTESICIKCF